MPGTNSTQISIATTKDYLRWDDYVHNHPQSTPYHLTSWKQAVEAAYKHQAYYLIAEENGKIEGTLPLIQLSPPFLINNFCSLPFCDVGHCLYDNDNVKQALLDFAFQLMQENNITNFEIRERYFSDLPACNNDRKNYSVAHKVSMILPLPENSETLWTSFKSKLKSQIRKAEKNGLTFDAGNSQEYVDKFYGVLSRNMKDLGSPVHSKQWFSEIAKSYNDKSLIGLVKMNDIVIGAGLLLFAGNKVAIPWASTLREYNRYSPNMLLYWNLLKLSADADYQYFDFGRSSPDEGTFKFKKQWGAQPIALNWEIFNANGEQITKSKDNGLARTIVEKIWRKLPLNFANRLGPLIRRYISL